MAFLPTTALPVWLWLTVIYLVVFVVNASEQFFNPSRFATIGDVVSGDVDRARAAGSSLWREFVAGLRMFAGNRFLVALLTAAVITQLGTGALNTLDVFFLTDNLHTNAHLLGFISMAFGIGSIIGALTSGRVVKLIGARRTSWIMLIVTGILILIFARQTIFVAALVTFFFIAIPATMLNTSLTPLMLAATPREYLGRMLAVFNPINTAASTVSVVVAGWLASTALLHFHARVGGLHIGRIDAIFTVAGLLVVAGGVFAAIAFPPDAASAETNAQAGDASDAPIGQVAEIAAPGVVPTQGVTEPLIDPASS
jgi:Na+/melibiose symporter-like transporter